MCPNLVGVQPRWYLDNGSTTFELSVHDQQWHVRWILRECGITLTSPDPRTLVDPVVSSSFRGLPTIMFRIIANDNQVKDDQTTDVVGKGPDFVRFGAKLAEEAFQQVG